MQQCCLVMCHGHQKHLSDFGRDADAFCAPTVAVLRTSECSGYGEEISRRKGSSSPAARLGSTRGTTWREDRNTIFVGLDPSELVQGKRGACTASCSANECVENDRGFSIGCLRAVGDLVRDRADAPNRAEGEQDTCKMDRYQSTAGRNAAKA